MKFSLTELVAKITGLEARAEAQFKAELETLKSTVTGALTQAQADLTTALASLATMTTERNTLLAGKTDFEAKITNLTTDQAGINKFFSEACLNGSLIELKGEDGKPLAADATAELKMAAMLAVPLAQKQTAYAGALNAAFAKANLPNSTLPKAPAKEAGATTAQDNSMKRADFFKLSPKAQTEFCKNGGKITE